MDILICVAVLGAIAICMGIFLAIASKAFEVEIDPKVEKINEVLPGANCGACGFPGCTGYAEAIVDNGAEINLCPPGGSQVTNNIASILGLDSDNSNHVKMIAKIMCKGDNTKTSKLYNFDVELKGCSTSMLYFGGDKSCLYSCLGYGDCVSVCPTNAIMINNKGIAEVNENRCISCKKCVKECPKHIIKMLPETQEVIVSCSSKDKGVYAKKACQVACIGCGICKKTCPVDAISIEEDLATIDPNTCINCGLCAIKCPTDAIESNIKEIKKASIIEENCIGCTACKRVCPVGAIEGEVKKKHKVDKNKCIGCQLCYEKCKFNAIEMDIEENNS